MTSRPTLLSRLGGDERGSETVELAIILPLLLVLALGSFPLLDGIATRRDIARVVDEAAVFATRADAHPTQDLDCGGLTRRRSFADVDAFVRAGHPDVTAVDVYVQGAGDPAPDMTATSSQHPCTAPAHSRVHIRVTAQHTTGPVTRTVNALARLLGPQDELFPTNAVVSATSAGYLE